MSKRDTNAATQYDFVVYLLFELERALRRKRIKWTRERAMNVYRRLVDLSTSVEQIARRLDE